MPACSIKMRISIIKDLASLLYEDIHKRNKTAPFIIFVTFIISFAAARLTVIILPGVSIVIRDYHIHHFYYGIALISAAAWIGLVSSKERLHRIGSVLFGAGLGLVTDEIGLLLTCNSEGLNCNYYARGSFDFAVFLGLLFLMIIYFPPFWQRMKKRVGRAVVGRIKR